MKSIIVECLAPVLLLAASAGAFAQPDKAPKGIQRPLGPGIRCVAFSPDGTLLAATFGEPKERGRVVLWSVAVQKRLWSHVEDDGVPAVTFAPDGKTMAIGSYDNNARLLETKTGRTLRVFTGHTNYVRAVSIAPDNKTLASGSWDGTVRTWDLATGTLERTLPALENALFTTSYSPGGKWLMASEPGLRLWEAATGKEKTLKDLQARYLGWTIFLDDHAVIISASGTIRLCNLDTGEHRVLFKGYASRLAHSLPARKLALAGGRQVQLFDFPPQDPTARDKQRISNLLRQLDDDSYDARESASKELLAIGILAEPDLRRAMKESSSAEVRIRCRRLRDQVLANPRAKLTGKTGDIEGLALSPDGRLLAAGGKGGVVCVWTLNDLKQAMQLTPGN